MSGNYTHLIGAEDVRRAGYQIDNAADTFSRAVGSFESAVIDLTRALEAHSEVMKEFMELQKDVNKPE